MTIQKSFKEQKPTLYLVATPIGNLSDMTPRAIETLQRVDLIASEDTRVTRKLCTHFDISTPLMSYHEHNEKAKDHLILDRLHAGEDVALVSDAGMPLISDPGANIVRQVIDAGFHVIPIPGASAVLTALIASGVVPHPFFFHGFLARKSNKKKAELDALKGLKATLIFYESPYRARETLSVMLDVFGNREVALARELTKIHETFLRGTLRSLSENLEEIKGEVVLIVGPPSEDETLQETQNDWDNLTIQEHVKLHVDAGLRTNDAIKLVAKERNLDRKTIYNVHHQI